MNLRRVVPSGVLVAVTCLGSAVAQAPAPRHGFWADIQLGYSSLHYVTAEAGDTHRGSLAVGILAGLTPWPWLRAGLALQSWELQSGSYNEPSKGEGVGTLAAVLQVYPLPSRGLFLRAEVGRAYYTNNRPGGFDSSGWGVLVGAGYDLPVSRKLAFAAFASYARGGLGEVVNPLATSTHRRYHVLEAGAGLSVR